jgi:glycolate oxidase iron-sulfur subunit
METRLTPEFAASARGQRAERILRSCVHCGFCNATCPTYQLLGDELDGPRGRIYLIKQVLEGAQPTRETQQHLDRCLTCRNCESTCPSGVKYGQLVDIGREIVEERVNRPTAEAITRTVLREGLTSPAFAPALRLGQKVRALLPAPLQAKVPQPRPAGAWPERHHARKVLMLAGCVQPAMAPSIDAATARVLDALGVQAVVAPGSGCCGAIRQHLADGQGAKADARRNIDAWWPWLQPAAGSGAEGAVAEALLINASGCGAMIKEYGHLLQDDPTYADKARFIADHTHDLSQWLAEQLSGLRQVVRAADGPAIAFHPPCTLQHAQQVRGVVESILLALGARLVPVNEAHLCCGSAGTYSVLQPELSRRLRDRKIEHLQAGAPEQILSANIGCLAHLQAGTATPVRHWIEWVDERLTADRLVPERLPPSSP